jgi:hypothetical protein
MVMNSMSKQFAIKWLVEPDEHDYPAAYSYLNLLYPKKNGPGVRQKTEAGGDDGFQIQGYFPGLGLGPARQRQFPCAQGSEKN